MSEPVPLKIEMLCADLLRTGAVAPDVIDAILSATSADLVAAWNEGEAAERYRTDFLVGDDTSRVVVYSGPTNPYVQRARTANGEAQRR
jgi:hypothetical protein